VGGVENSFDAVVVGAGPAGATAAYHLARLGRRVLVVDKATFPREKVCGDGLTPRAVAALQRIDIDTEGPEWSRSKGLRIVGGGVTLELPWPELSDKPNHALVLPRFSFDDLLLQAATKAGAEVWEQTEATGPILDADGVVAGVVLSRSGDRQEVHAPVVIVGDGVANRFGLGAGVRRIDKRPMGVAVRTYFRSPRSEDGFLESYLEMWRGDELLPGYGWIFPVADGTVNVGLGMLNTSPHFGRVDYRQVLWDWVAGLPPEWGFTRENQVGGKIRGGSLPMAFNRTPLAKPGLMVVGDAAGAINPFNGEGIAYAMETAEHAAEVAHEALAQGDPRALRAYPERLKEAYDAYFTLGRIFVRVIGDSRVMGALTKHGMRREWLMRFALKILGNLTEPRAGDANDRIINALVRAAPALNLVARQ
jgi:geranylgeranyl reductase family protein